MSTLEARPAFGVELNQVSAGVRRGSLRVDRAHGRNEAGDFATDTWTPEVAGSPTLPSHIIDRFIDPQVRTAERLDAMRDRNGGLQEVLFEAAASGGLQDVNRLLEAGVDATADDSFAFRLAARNGHLPVVERLLQVPLVDPTAEDNYAIQWAARRGHLAVVERLLQVPLVDATAVDNYAIKLAAQNGHLAVLERLLQVPLVDATAQGNYALRWAAENGHLAVVDRLMQVPAVAAMAAQRVD